MKDSRKELLVPAAQQYPAAALKVFDPGLLVFDTKPEGPAVTSDKVVKEPLDEAYKNIPVFFQQRNPAYIL